MDVQEQAERFIEHANRATELVITYIETHREVIRRRALNRLTSIGASDYGDASWHKPAETLALETLDEFADAVVYVAIMLSTHGESAAISALGLAGGQFRDR